MPGTRRVVRRKRRTLVVNGLAGNIFRRGCGFTLEILIIPNGVVILTKGLTEKKKVLKTSFPLPLHPGYATDSCYHQRSPGNR